MLCNELVIMDNNLEKLTQKEEEVMQVLWKLEKAFVNDILDHFPEPKPHRNTVSTVLKRLKDKGYVSHEAFGPTHRYFPLISKAVYRKAFFDKIVDTYFDESPKSFLAYFAKEERISKEDLEDIIRMIEKGKDQ